ncbi:MAG: DUF4197 domain-containing protein [Chromatiales bacterium]|nr:MAG: DUF4197 domain-containing protein [Chromatiales bacterium]
MALIAILGSPLPAGADWLDDLFGKSVDKPASASELTTSQIGAGLKEALEVGTVRVVDTLGREDGFNADPLIRIPLPDSLKTVQSTLAKVGMAGTLDNLELELNRAAELATPKAKALFIDAIRTLTLDDVMAIYNGPDDAATQYLRGQMSDPLAEAMEPIVDQSLDQVGAAATYESAMGQYNALPFVPKVEADLTTYVVGKGLDGIFLYLAKEEAAIRNDPVERTTELLQQVFGAR